MKCKNYPTILRFFFAFYGFEYQADKSKKCFRLLLLYNHGGWFEDIESVYAQVMLSMSDITGIPILSADNNWYCKKYLSGKNTNEIINLWL